MVQAWTAQNILEGGWERVFPTYNPGQLFALVSNIEDYPRFVPGCVATRILRKTSDDIWTVENIFGFGPVRTRFISRATLYKGEGLEIVSKDGPWKDFYLTWNFSPQEGGAYATCRYFVEFKSPILSKMARVCLPEIERATISGFETRAKAVCV